MNKRHLIELRLALYLSLYMVHLYIYINMYGEYWRLFRLYMVVRVNRWHFKMHFELYCAELFAFFMALSALRGLKVFKIEFKEYIIHFKKYPKTVKKKIDTLTFIALNSRSFIISHSPIGFIAQLVIFNVFTIIYRFITMRATVPRSTIRSDTI